MNRDDAAHGARRRARPWLIATGAVVALAAAWVAFAVLTPSPDSDSDSDSEPTPVAQVATASASSRASTVLNASGYVVPRRVATIASKVTGQIISVAVEEGQRVAAGDVLARLDDAIARAELDLAATRLATARRAEAEIQVRVDEAQRTLERSRTLREQRLTSEADLDAAQANAAALTARLAVAGSEVAVADSAVALARQRLDDTVIRAPFDGVVVSKNAQPGETISPMSSGGFTRTGIATIVDMASLEIEVDVNEAFINRVSDGQRVEAVLDAYPDWRIPARVISIVPTADRQKATVKVRIGFDTLDPRILPEMGVQVWFLEGDQ